jgi:hypothetical protein
VKPAEEAIRQLDAAIRSDLVAYRDLYFWGLIVFTAIVVIGLILEGVEFLPHPKPLLDARRGIISPRFRLIRWMKRAEHIGWFVVVAGVAGEGVFEGLGSVADGQLQTFDAALMTDTQNNTALANERAEALRKQNLLLHLGGHPKPANGGHLKTGQ